VSEFEAYRRRADRLKALEKLLEAARDVFAVAANSSGTAATWEALAKLRRNVEEVDKLPPLHRTALED
jgi:hypothetical protein